MRYGKLSNACLYSLERGKDGINYCDFNFWVTFNILLE